MPDLTKDQNKYATYTPAFQPPYSQFPCQQDPEKFSERVKGKLSLS